MSIEQDKINAGLDEVRRLNLRKQELEKQIQTASRDLEKKQKSLKDMHGEVEKYSAAAQQARKDHAQALSVVANAKKELETSRGELEDLQKKIAKDKAVLEEKIAQDIEILSQINASKVNAKEANAKAEAQLTHAKALLAEAEAMKQKYETGISDNKSLMLALEATKQAVEKEHRAAMKDLCDQQAKIAEDAQLLINRREELEKAVNEANRQTKLAEAAELAWKEKLKELDDQKDVLKRSILSNEKEREAIAYERKKVEIDRLRIDKLAKDRQVDKELEELRKADA